MLAKSGVFPVNPARRRTGPISQAELPGPANPAPMPLSKISRRRFLQSSVRSGLAISLFDLSGVRAPEPVPPSDGFVILEGEEAQQPSACCPNPPWRRRSCPPTTAPSRSLLRYKKGEEVKIRLINKLPHANKPHLAGACRMAAWMASGVHAGTGPPSAQASISLHAAGQRGFWPTARRLGPFVNEQLGRGLCEHS